MKKSIITYVVVIALIVLLAFTAAFGLDLGFAKIPSVEDGVTLGLDLVGGSEITYEAQIPDGTSDADVEAGISSAITMLRQRLDSLGYSEATVQKQGTDQIVVDIPAVSNPEEAASQIGTTAVVEFRTSDYDADAGTGMMADGNIIKSAKAEYGAVDSTGNQAWHVVLEFTSEGQEKFAEITKYAANQSSGSNNVGIYLDGTLGRAGHSWEIVRRLTAGGRLIGLDRDETALEAARRRLAPYIDRVTLVHSNFSCVAQVLDQLNVPAVDGMLFDLGVSSPQLDDAQRGFSYMHNAPLDMRMDRTAGLTARTVVNEWPYEELRRILYEYGEERYAPAIARRIVTAREEAPIETTGQLVELIKSAMPPQALREKQHPAKRSFQAIRIAVNDELGAVREAMEKAIDCLNPGGRLAVITFHSLEDRIVKAAFNQAAQGCTCPKDFPVCVCGKKPKVRLTPRKPILPSDEEIEENPRARSAKLRVCEKI